MASKFIKKLAALFLCASFLSVQITFANQMTGGVLNDIGTGGADITGSHGGFDGFNTNGTNADLNFSGDAVIDWGHLNVGNGQSLNFVNGNNVVLNNVLNGMSTFAGAITGQNGTIIISNPNGMIMQAGGSIETSGALILTTKDLVNKYTFDKNENLNIDFDNAGYKDNTYSIISLNSGTISGGDINIISKGIDINSSNITSTGNISFTTSDGANFIANYKPSENNNIKFNQNSALQIANSSIKSGNEVKLVTNGSNMLVKDTSVTGKLTGQTDKIIFINGGNITDDVNLTAERIGINYGLDSKTNIGGSLITNTLKNISLHNTDVTGDTIINAGTVTDILNSKFYNLTADAGDNIKIKNSSIAKDVKVIAGKADNKNEKQVFIGNSNIEGNLNASSERGFIHVSGGEMQHLRLIQLVPENTETLQ